jgi:hypothetical protein
MIKELIKLLCPALGFRMHVAAAMVGAAAVGAVGSNMAANTAADGQKSAAEAANSPWSAAQPYVAYGFDPAKSALDQGLAQGNYTGELTAGLHQYQTQGADGAAAWANGNGANSANTFYNTGTTLSNQGAAFTGNAGNLYNTANQNSGNNAQSFANFGNQLATGSLAQSQIDAANQSVQRSLNQSQLPTLMSAAAGNGQTDSTRTGVSAGLLQSQAQQNMLANATAIQSNLFNQGSQMAQSQYNTQQQQALAANQQLGQGYTLGNTALQNANTTAGSNYNMLEGAGGVYQNQQQNVDNANYSQFYQNQTNALNLIGNYENVIGGKWGGQAVSSVGPSAAAASLQGAVGGATSAYGLYNQYQNLYGNSGASGLQGGQSALNVANASNDPIASLNATQGWT